MRTGCIPPSLALALAFAASLSASKSIALFRESSLSFRAGAPAAGEARGGCAAVSVHGGMFARET